MKVKSFLILQAILTIALTSCDKATPAGFWNTYKTDFLRQNISDQGPNGGNRAIYWKADKTESFNSKNILDFAKKNGWTLVDSSDFDQEQTDKWTYNDKPIFPLTSKGFSNKILDNELLKSFPRWFGGHIKVYKFKTGWVAIEPGTDNSINDNGFVLMDNDKTQIAVYHLWGD